MSNRERFSEISEWLRKACRDDEGFSLSLSAERSDFVRLSGGMIRQPGHVEQAQLLIDWHRNSAAGVHPASLRCPLHIDHAELAAHVDALRARCRAVPADAHFNAPTGLHSSEFLGESAIPDCMALIDELLRLSSGLDLVGLVTHGEIERGFADHRGQNNWHAQHSYLIDCSAYLDRQTAAKLHDAGFVFDRARLATKIDALREQLAILAKPAIPLEPGLFRSYLAPRALAELFNLLSGSFSIKSHRSGQSALRRMSCAGQRLHPLVNLSEGGVPGQAEQSALAASFTPNGFLRQTPVALIREGILSGYLAGPRSAREFAEENVPISGEDWPNALQMAPGDLQQHRLLSALDTGLWINDLWYCNFSERNNCRLTGMTRFACFWVENGVIQAPVKSMRFDDSLFALLGSELIALTAQRELLIDTDSYGERSTSSMLLPGALVESLRIIA